MNVHHLHPKTLKLVTLLSENQTMAVFSGNYVTAETGVFWDIDQCGIPDELSAADVTQRIRDNLFDSGHRGTVKIKAYGDKKDHDFLSAGVEINHFPPGERHARHTKMLEDLVSWASENPEPSTFMLIMGDTSGSDDFVKVIDLLKSEKNYMFLYVEPEPQPRPPVMMILIAPRG